MEMKTLIFYLILINIIAFALYGIDKHRAITHKWRISERMLIGVALIGGSIGAICGMNWFHHKTKHWYFKYGLPLILLVQIAVFLLLWKRMGI